jgi:hypothetical protein
VRLHRRGGGAVDLSADATAVALAPAGQVLVATRKGQVLVFDGAGERLSVVAAERDVKAMARVARWMALGFEDGNVEMVPVDADEPQPTMALEQTPSSPVVRMLAGPRDTLIVGYANGVVGVWTLDGGVLLDHVRLHGPAAHLVVHEGKLWAATELGDHRTMDLADLHSSYCDLLRRIWQQVPVVWEGGTAQLKPPPTDHACAAR